MSEQAKEVTPSRILVVVAHADDIEFGVAGSVAKWVREGVKVTYCIVTDNSAGSNEPGVDHEWLIQKREEEQRAAAAVVGVSDVRFLCYPDGELVANLNVRRDITRVIRDVRAQRVVCQDPSTIYVGDWYINHPDHRAAGEAAIYAVFPSACTRPIFAELLEEGYEPYKVAELYLMLNQQPDTFVDISETIDVKLKALLCHESQLGSDAADRVRERNRSLGEMAGFEYAEGFRVMKFGPIDELPEEFAEAQDIQPAEELNAEG
jgi:LmbE family N-acetylglucosaminyl deacetylase